VKLSSSNIFPNSLRAFIGRTPNVGMHLLGALLVALLVDTVEVEDSHMTHNNTSRMVTLTKFPLRSVFFMDLTIPIFVLSTLSQ
jgi:hypothetical protein